MANEYIKRWLTLLSTRETQIKAHFIRYHFTSTKGSYNQKVGTITSIGEDAGWNWKSYTLSVGVQNGIATVGK